MDYNCSGIQIVRSAVVKTRTAAGSGGVEEWGNSLTSLRDCVEDLYVAYKWAFLWYGEDAVPGAYMSFWPAPVTTQEAMLIPGPPEAGEEHPSAKDAWFLDEDAGYARHRVKEYVLDFAKLYGWYGGLDAMLVKSGKYGHKGMGVELLQTLFCMGLLAQHIRTDPLLQDPSEFLAKGPKEYQQVIVV